MADKKNSPVLLDCTLRDGGYYNDWDFDPLLVSRYFRAVEQAGIDVVEVGFRFFKKDKFLGPHAYTTDALLREMPLPKKAKISVMINASDLVGYPDGQISAIDALFDTAVESPVDMVRVASHMTEAPSLGPAIKRLKKLGYHVGVNLMQIGRYSGVEIRDTVSVIRSWNAADVLYFADSLGNMREEKIVETVMSIASEWSGPIGIHAHDNMGQGLHNTLVAHEHGATWLDATILGMGRGAGNPRMEFVVSEMRHRGCQQYNPNALLSVSMEDFSALQKRYGWGTNLLYYSSAQHEIHPTYVQSMYNDLKYDLPHVVGAMEMLKEMGGHSFSRHGLSRAVSAVSGDGVGNWDASEWLNNRDVLLLGAGPSVQQYANYIEGYIRETNCAVLSLNSNSPVSSELITAFIACHPSRILADIDDYIDRKPATILPVATLHPVVKERLSQVDHLDYGMTVNDSEYSVGSSGCVIPTLVVAAYAMALATAAGARRILMVGFDGFEGVDQRQKDMIDVIERYQDIDNAIPLVALTPTNYPVHRSSLFAPID